MQVLTSNKERNEWKLFSNKEKREREKKGKDELDIPSSSCARISRYLQTVGRIIVGYIVFWRSDMSN